jgi:hypothetical protein
MAATVVPAANLGAGETGNDFGQKDTESEQEQFMYPTDAYDRK